MAYRFRIDLCLVFLSTIVLAGCYLRLYRNGTDSGGYIRPGRLSLSARSYEIFRPQKALREELAHPSRHVSSVRDWVIPTRDSVLFPDWQILVFVSPDVEVATESGEEYQCVFYNNETSPARLDWVLPFTNSRAFKCFLPRRARRLRPFIQPALMRAAPAERREIHSFYSFTRVIFRWTFLVYESLSTENDVVLFAKGVNNRQGINRPPSELRCVFGENAATAVRTVVTTSNQEVFRCLHPGLTAFPHGEIENQRIKLSIEFSDENRTVLVPSVAYYTPMRTVAIQEPKSQLCASTMIFNAAKFLKEWVVYHTRIGVQQFILYDNGSDDELQKIVEELNRDGFNVETVLWPWPKTQEAGFSHSAIYAKETCKWMMYVDVDEFVFSPKWLNSSTPSTQMLFSLLPRKPNSNIGQISIGCNDFGPSNQQAHPVQGVTQGYTCRRRLEQRHKSVVLLDAVDSSLFNAVHHFGLKKGFSWKRLSLSQWVVNHYKYQAWSEFKAKFRRRVSAYVVDWTDETNPKSKDRAPGLGFLPIEPKGWATKFCEVRDERLKMLTQRWFGIGIPSTSEYKMAWEK